MDLKNVPNNIVSCFVLYNIARDRKLPDIDVDASEIVLDAVFSLTDSIYIFQKNFAMN